MNFQPFENILYTCATAVEGPEGAEAYSGIVNSKPYGENFSINKKECIGHVQKWMGTRLRALVKSSVVETETKTGKKVRRKSLSSKGKLTAKMIDKLTVCYGLAIRPNHNSVDKMKKAIWATYEHYSSTDDNPQHNNCPSGEDSWCEYQKATAANSLKSFKHNYDALPNEVLTALKPIYQDSSEEALVERCLGGFTQNNNESLNQLIWKISPKSVSGTATVVEIAANVAACTFNEGCFALLTFMQEMGIKGGPSAHEWARAVAQIRISRADEKTQNESKESRILRRQLQQDALDILKDSSLLYGPGIDDSICRDFWHHRDAVSEIFAMNDYQRQYASLLPDHSFNRNGKALRGSKKSALFYTTDCGDEKEDIGLKLQQRSVSLTALHTGGLGSRQQLLEPRMAQLETLEAKMASIEVSLSTTPRRKKGGSVSGGMTSPAGHRNRDQYKEVDALRVALRDKENIIQTLKGQLCNTLSNRLALRNGAPPLTEADRKATDERLQRLRRDADNKRLVIKNLKLALERLDITDNIDVRIQQAELEYRLGREELELLTLREESRALQAALELAETQEKQKNDTIFSCISGGMQMTVHAVEVSADPKSPRFGAGLRDDAAGLYVEWAVEDSGLCKGDRILEVNGKLVVGVGRSDLARLLAVAPDAAQIVVLRKSESLAALRSLRSDNLRLTHRIGYLEEQVRDLLTPTRSEVTVVETPPSRQEHVQVFQKGPQVTALIANLPGLNVRSPGDMRQSLPTVKSRHSDHARKFSLDPRSSKDTLDFSSDSATNGHHKSRGRQRGDVTTPFQLTRSTASLDFQQPQTHQLQSQRRRSSRLDCAMEQLHNSRKSTQALHSLEFDSEPTYYRMQDNQSRTSEHSEISGIYSSHETNSKARPAPPKKPLRLSLHRAASLQSVESAPSAPPHDPPRKPTKRNHRGDPPTVDKNGRSDSETSISNNHHNHHHRRESVEKQSSNSSNAPQPPPRTPSRAESCQSALRWPSPKPRPHLTSVPMEKWC